MIFTAIIFISITNACFATNSQTSETLVAVNFSLPKPAGKYGVGRQLTFLSDENRKREIAVWIYYPADALKNLSEEPILPQKWAEGYRNSLEKRLGKSAANALLSAKTNSKTGAEILSAKEIFPVLIFAPGANWLPTDYSATIEEIVSYGYVVVAFSASPLSPVVLKSNGQIVDSQKVDDSTYALIAEDFRFIANQLEKLNQDSSLKIKGQIDLNKIGAFGHSIGGAAAVLAASGEPKIKASANLDGDFAGDSINAAPAQAILYLTTEPPNLSGAPFEKWDEDRSENRRKGVWEKIRANSVEAFRVRMAKMYHSNFQDAALLPPDSIPENFRKTRFGAINGKRGVELTTKLLIEFFDSQLKSSVSDKFAEIEKQNLELKVERRQQ